MARGPMLLVAAGSGRGGSEPANVRSAPPGAVGTLGRMQQRQEQGSARTAPAPAERRAPTGAGPATRRQLLRGAAGAASLAALGALGTGAVAAQRSLRGPEQAPARIPLLCGTVAHADPERRVRVGGDAPDLELPPSTPL